MEINIQEWNAVKEKFTEEEKVELRNSVYLAKPDAWLINEYQIASPLYIKLHKELYETPSLEVQFP